MEAGLGGEGLPEGPRALRAEVFGGKKGKGAARRAAPFGASGAGRCARSADVLEGVDHDNIEYKEIRGTKGFKEAVYKVAGMDVKVAVVSGLNNANELLKKIESLSLIHI